MTTREMLQRMDSEEITEQMAYDLVNAEDMQRARSGVPPAPHAVPSPDEVTRKVRAYFGRRAAKKAE